MFSVDTFSKIISESENEQDREGKNDVPKMASSSSESLLKHRMNVSKEKPQ